MSNHARFSPVMANGQLGTAYGPNAEGSAEGDILAALNVTSSEVGPRGDDPDLGVSAYDMRGLREDDSGLRLGTDPQYERALRGLREDDASLRVLSGLREDDSNLRMGRTGDAGSGTEGDAEGSAEGLRTQQMGGILVSDGRAGAMIGVSAYDSLGVSAYDAVMRGLREDDANLRISGLREDDAGLRMGDAYSPDAEGSAEGDRGWAPGQQAVHMGAMQDEPRLDPRVGVSAYDMRGLREDDASLRVMSGLREDDAGLRMGVSAYDRLKGLREQDTNLVLLSMAGLREDDAGLRIGEVRTAMMLRGLADAEDVVDEMGRRRAWGKLRKMSRPGHRKFMKGTGERNVRSYDEMGVSAYDQMGVSAYDTMGVSAYDRLGAEDFHPRFPSVMIEGLGTMSGFFDFLRTTPSDEEYLGKIRVVLQQWDQIKPELLGLPDQQRVAIGNNMVAAQADFSRYESLRGFLAEGASAKTLGRWDRVLRLETYLPTLRTLIAQAKALGPSYTPAQVNKDAAKDVQQRIDATEKPSFIQQAAPYAAGAVGTGLVVTLLTLV